jgi:hypothetical protein
LLRRDGGDGPQRLGVVAQFALPAAGDFELRERLERAAQRRGLRGSGLLDAAIGRPRAPLQRVLDLSGRLARLQARRDGEDVAHAAGHERHEPRERLALGP